MARTRLISFPRRILTCLVFSLLLFGATRLSAQDKRDFTPQRYFEVGGEYAFCLSSDWNGKAGAYFIIGKQRSAKTSIGVGIGFDYYRDKDGDVKVGIGDATGTVHEKTFKKDRYNVPVFADFRFNFSQGKDPFYLNLRAGATLGFSDSDLEDGGIVASAGIGKAFNAGGVTISPYVRADVGTLFAGGGAGAWIEPLIALGVNFRF